MFNVQNSYINGPKVTNTDIKWFLSSIRLSKTFFISYLIDIMVLRISSFTNGGQSHCSSIYFISLVINDLPLQYGGPKTAIQSIYPLGVHDYFSIYNIVVLYTKC